MNNRPYHEQVDIANTQKLRELIAALPPFVKDFFRGIEPTTSSRTRIAYAYDLNVFFDYLQRSNPSLRSVDKKKLSSGAFGSTDRLRFDGVYGISKIL